MSIDALADANWDLIPHYLQPSLDRYLSHGIRPGGFMHAVLHNDLKQSVMLADGECLKHLPDIVRFLYNYAPRECWGSLQNIERWEFAGGLNGVVTAGGIVTADDATGAAQ